MSPHLLPSFRHRLPVALDAGLLAITVAAALGLLAMVTVPLSAEEVEVTDAILPALAEVTPIQPLHGLMIDAKGNLWLRGEPEALIVHVRVGDGDLDHPNAMLREISERCRWSYDMAPAGWSLLCMQTPALDDEMRGDR